MKIIPLSEGTFTIDSTKVFTPFNKNKDNLQQRSPGSLLVEIQPFVLVTENDIIVLDTGLGFLNRDNVLQIHQNLLDNGIKPDMVTKVLLSHLHKDHAGGISFRGNNNKTALSFPNAFYFVSKKEIEYALQNENASYLRDDFTFLLSSGKLSLLEMDAGYINKSIYYEINLWLHQITGNQVATLHGTWVL